MKDLTESLNIIRAGLFGLAVGDALGVPGEFCDRERLRGEPITDMRGGGCHNMPAGTWSDDTSMTLCLADSLALHGGFLPFDVMERFVRWVRYGEYTADGRVFDIGNACRQAIFRFANGMPPEHCGGLADSSNGNGSLMRVLPVAYLLHSKGKTSVFDDAADAELVSAVSSLTHAHPRSIIACGIYIETALGLICGKAPNTAAADAIEKAAWFYKAAGKRWHHEFSHYSRLEHIESFRALGEEEIKSSGYVVDTLEAALWCLLNTGDYSSCILRAVNLGEDTDTVAAVAGGLAGIYYGLGGIPESWRDTLRNKEAIEDIAKRSNRRLYKNDNV